MQKLLPYIQCITFTFFFGIGQISGKNVLLDVDDLKVHIDKAQKNSHHIPFLKEDTRNQQNPAEDSKKGDSEEEERKEKEEIENEKNEKKKRLQQFYLSSDFLCFIIKHAHLIYEHFAQKIISVSYYTPKYILYNNLRI